MKRQPLHSGLKKRIFHTASMLAVFFVGVITIRPDAANAISTVAGSYFVLCGAIAGARAWHQTAILKQDEKEPPLNE